MKMVFDPNQPNRVNWYALVTYIPDPLGTFLDRLRQELVPSCSLHSHVSILPPRPVRSSPESAWSQLRSRIQDIPAFVIEPTDVQIFPETSVVYIEIGAGRSDLLRAHDLLNFGDLEYQEPYSFHPHITLAQGIPPEEVPAVYELARKRWKEFRYERAFPVDSFTFVRSTPENGWLDLAELYLAATPTLK